MIKSIFLTLLAAIAAALLYAATKPNTFAVERKLLIAAPPEALFPLIDDLHGFNRWSPYLAKDPSLKGSFEGPTAGPGAVYRWAGNQDVGKGSMTIRSHTPGQQVVIDLQILEPFAGNNTVTFTLKPQAGGTEVTWAMDGPQPYITKVLTLVFNMDKMIGGDFETGLANLRKLVETR